MADPRVHWEKTDGGPSAAPQQNHGGKKQRDEKAAAESMHHDGSFGRYIQLKVTKLREQFDAQQLQNAAAKSDIFRGVSIHVNGFTRPSHAELKQLMALHGGRFENYLHRDSVTHIVCSNLPDTKIKQLAHERKPIPIVRPEWVVASITAGRLLPISDFQLEPLSAAHPNQRRLFDFKRHAAPQLPPEELYPVLQQHGQQHQGAAHQQLPQGPQQQQQQRGIQQQQQDGQAGHGRGPQWGQLRSEGPRGHPYESEDAAAAAAAGEGRPAKRLRTGAEAGGQPVAGEEAQQRWPQYEPGEEQEEEEDYVPEEWQQEDPHDEWGAAQHRHQQRPQHQQQEQHQRPTLGSLADGSHAAGGAHAPPQPCGFGTGPGPPTHSSARPPPGVHGGPAPLHAPRAGASRTPSPGLDAARGPGLLTEPEPGAAASGGTIAAPAAGPLEAAAAAAAQATTAMPAPPPPPSPPTGPEAAPGPSVPPGGPTSPGPPPGSPQAAQALAAELRAASDLARGPPRSTRTDPRFMETFFRASRLHFIGTWKTRIEALMAEVEGAAPNPAPYTKGTERVILHVDMDCFFASAAAVDRPDLAGQPLAVSHSNSARGTGEVSSANYLARSFGVRADMFISEAKRRCPGLVVVPYEFDKYQRISEQVYRIFMSYTSVVQPVSCDEAYLDVTGLGLEDPEQLAARLRAQIASTTQCTASAGIGPNMLIAKLATKRAKPNGQFRVIRGSVLDFLGDLNVDELPGVGWSLSSKLEDLGICRVRQVWSSSRTLLQKQLGAKVGADLWAHAHGQDERKVEPPKARKSVGAEVNYGIRFEADAGGQAEAERFIGELAGEVAARMKTAGVRGRSLVLKVKRRQAGAPEPAKFMGHGACDNISRTVTLSRFTDDPALLRREAVGLLRALAIPPEELRGLGLSVAKLDNDPASHTTRASAPAPAKLAAPPRTAFDASKPPPWAAFFQRKNQQQHQQAEPEQRQQQQVASEQGGALRAASPPGDPTSPAKRGGPAPAAVGGGATTAAVARSPSPAAGAVEDVPSWYASLYNEWSPVSVWEQQRRSAARQQQQQLGQPLGQRRSSSPAAAAGAAAAGEAGKEVIRPAQAQPGDAGEPETATAAAEGTVAAVGAAAASRSRPRPRLHPVFAALLSSQPAAAATSGGRGGDAGSSGAGLGPAADPHVPAAGAAPAGAPQPDMVPPPRAAAAVPKAPPSAGAGAGTAVAEGGAATGPAAPSAAAAAPLGEGPVVRRGLLDKDGGEAALAPICQQQQPPQAAPSAPAAEGLGGTAAGSRSAAANPRPPPPAPRPAASGTHGGGGGASAAFAVPAAVVPRAVSRPVPAPTISTASAAGGLPATSGGATRGGGCVESIDLSVDLGDDDDDGGYDGGGGAVTGAAGFGYQGAPELLEAAGETADGAAATGPIAAAARPAHSETTTMGGPAVSTSAAASGSAAARWPAAFLRPATGAGAAARAGGGGRGRGRGRGAGAAGGGRGGGSSGGRGRSGGGGAGGRGSGPAQAPAAPLAAAQIDRSVLAELPPEVRREVEREYGLLAAAPARRPAPAPAPGPSRPAKRSRVGPAADPPANAGALPRDAGQGPPAAERVVTSEGGAVATSGGVIIPREGASFKEGFPARREPVKEREEPQARPQQSAQAQARQDDVELGDPAGTGPSRPCARAAEAAAAPDAPDAAAVAAMAVAMPTSMADVDLAVLDELPPELRCEITAALQRGGAAGRSAGPVGAVATAAVAGTVAAAQDGDADVQRPPPRQQQQQEQQQQVQGCAGAAAAAAAVPPRQQRQRPDAAPVGVAGAAVLAPPLPKSAAGAVPVAARPAAAGAAPVGQGQGPAVEDLVIRDSPDVLEVAAVEALPEGAGPQQRLAAAAAHMFGGAVAASNAASAAAADVRRAFLAAVRSACERASPAAAHDGAGAAGGRVAPRARGVDDSPGAGAGTGGDQEGGAAQGSGKREQDADEEHERVVRVTFMSLALWLMGQDADLEGVVALLRQVLRLVGGTEPGPGPRLAEGRQGAGAGAAVGARRLQRVRSHALRAVRAVREHVLHKHGFMLKL